MRLCACFGFRRLGAKSIDKRLHVPALRFLLGAKGEGVGARLKPLSFIGVVISRGDRESAILQSARM